MKIHVKKGHEDEQKEASPQRKMAKTEDLNIRIQPQEAIKEEDKAVFTEDLKGENEQLRCDIKKWIEFKDNMVAKLEKAEADNKDLTKDINEMRTAINTSTNREGNNIDNSKALEIIEIKNRMHLMEEENLQLFNEKTLFKGEAEKAVQTTHRLNEYIATLVVELKNANSPIENPQLEQEN